MCMPGVSTDLRYKAFALAVLVLVSCREVAAGIPFAKRILEAAGWQLSCVGLCRHASRDVALFGFHRLDGGDSFGLLPVCFCNCPPLLSSEERFNNFHPIKFRHSGGFIEVLSNTPGKNVKDLVTTLLSMMMSNQQLVSTLAMKEEPVPYGKWYPLSFERVSDTLYRDLESFRQKLERRYHSPPVLINSPRVLRMDPAEG